MVRVIMQIKMQAMPKSRRCTPAAKASSCRIGRISRMMGVASTLSPTPQGRARMAMTRKAEEIMRSAPT